jgi:putative addiction module component (TIGR02574 family)
MPTSLPQLEAQAMQLNRHEREQLADRLWFSLDDSSPSEVQAAWDTELAKRSASLTAGTAELIPAEQVMARLQQRLNQA